MLLRQLSATTLPPSTLGFLCRSSNSSGCSSAPVPAWTPFSSSNSAAVAAAGGGKDGGSNAMINGSSSGGWAWDDASPLLPLTYSDEISIDSADTDTAATSTEGAFNYKLVFQQMLPSTIEAPSITFEQHSRVVSMDQVLARLPRGRAVRLYPVTARNNVMWEAVQGAFAFFSTNEGAAAAAAAATGGAGVLGGSSGSSNTAAAAGGGGGGGVLRGGSGMSDSLSSIQSLNLTQSGSRKQLQQQQGLEASISNASEQQQQQWDGSSASDSATAAAAAAAGGPGLPVTGPTNGSSGAAGTASSSAGSVLGSAVVQRVSRVSAAASSPTKAAAAAGSQLFSAISNLGSGLRQAGGGGGAGNPALSGLTDILEIRTDVEAYRMISSPDQPPQVRDGLVLLPCTNRVSWHAVT